MRFDEVEIVARLVFCGHSAIAMRIGARLPGAQFTLLPRGGPTSQTRDSECLFWDEFFSPHTNSMFTAMVNETKFWGKAGLVSRYDRHRPTL